MACTAIDSLKTCAIRTDSIIAEVEPSVLAAVVRGNSFVPAQRLKINLRTVAIMADFMSSVVKIVLGFSITRKVKLRMFVDKATLVAWVVYHCLKTTDVGAKDIRYNWLSHSFFLFSLLIINLQTQASLIYTSRQ